MKKLLLAVLFVSFVAASSAFAATFKLPDDKSVVSITIPDSWKPEEIEHGVQGQTSDDEIYISAETTKSEKGMNKIIDETFDMLKEHKVVLKPESKKEQKFEINGLKAEELLYDGKDEDGPATVSITFITVQDTILVLTYWASPEGEKKHDKDITSIVKSIKAIK